MLDVVGHSKSYETFCPPIDRGQLFVLLYIPKKNLKAVRPSTFVGHVSENVEILMNTYGKALVALLGPALPVGAESTSASVYY